LELESGGAIDEEVVVNGEIVNNMLHKNEGVANPQQ